MNKQFFYESLEKKSLLFSAILNFNLEQHKKTLPYSNLENFLQTDFLTGNTFKKYQKPSPALFWDFADETKRLVLLDIQSLVKLARVLGVSLYAEEISHILDRKSVLQLQNELGKELYFYALERGKFRLHEIKERFKNTGNTPFFSCLHTRKSKYGNDARRGALNLVFCQKTPFSRGE